MKKYEILPHCSGGDFVVGERILKGNYLSKVTDILLDVGSTTYLTLSFSSVPNNIGKVAQRWISTVELKDFSIKELVELTVDLIKSSSCNKLMIDSQAHGKAVIDGLIPILEKTGKSHLLEIATKEDMRNAELLEIVADIDSKMSKLKELMDNN